jgi:hypothetical protein
MCIYIYIYIYIYIHTVVPKFAAYLLNGTASTSGLVVTTARASTSPAQ